MADGDRRNVFNRDVIASWPRAEDALHSSDVTQMRSLTREWLRTSVVMSVATSVFMSVPMSVVTSAVIMVLPPCLDDTTCLSSETRVIRITPLRDAKVNRHNGLAR